MKLQLDNVIRIPCNKEQVFKYWIDFVSLYYNLTQKEVTVIVDLLKWRENIKEQNENISDENLYLKLFSTDVKKKIADNKSMNIQYLNNVLSSLRKKNIIINNQLVRSIIPNYKKDKDNFQLMILLDFIDAKTTH